MARQEVNNNSRGGRTSQRNRTRKALAAAAQKLMRAGGQPSVTEAAEAAGISRATAYRYFPTQEMLWAEVALFDVDGPLFAARRQGEPAAEAVADLVRRVGAWAYRNEQPLRTLLRLSLDSATEVRRPGHRIEWIAEVLAPVRNQMDAETYDRLSRALTLVIGIDPIVVMKDIAAATREQALDTLAWTARTLVEAALHQGGSRRA